MVEQATGRISALLSGKAFLLVLDSYEPRPALEKLEALHWHCKILTIFRPEDTGGAGSPDPAAVAVPPFDTETAREFMRAKGLATDQGLHEAILVRTSLPTLIGECDASAVRLGKPGKPGKAADRFPNRTTSTTSKAAV